MTRRMIWAIALGLGGAVLATAWRSRRPMRGQRGRASSGSFDPVMEASEDSFPASDPPSHTPTTGTRI